MLSSYARAASAWLWAQFMGIEAPDRYEVADGRHSRWLLPMTIITNRSDDGDSMSQCLLVLAVLPWHAFVCQCRYDEAKDLFVPGTDVDDFF